MPQVIANKLEIEYEVDGPADGEPMLLVMGTGGQLTRWPAGLVDRFTAKGFRVIRYDARDVGLSAKLDRDGVPDLAAVVQAVAKGQPAPVPYHLEDMAADAVGLLDAIGVRSAHIVGASMGGMIAQLIAADHADHVRSLTSIMSTTGNPTLPTPAPALMSALTRPAPDPDRDLDAFVDHMLATARLTESPAYPTDEAAFRQQIIGDYRRSHYPAGILRHTAAAFAAPDRRPKLKAITAPTLVIHGEEDPLMPPAGGRDTADTIPGAELLMVPGMGHDLPPELFDLFADAIARHARRQ
jgi:pimeloyl-ACP methyl ester carboxylesterase